MGALFAGDLACYVRGLCAPVGRCRLSQQSNNNSACRYTVMLALARSKCMGISSTAFEHNDTCPKDLSHSGIT